MVPLLSIDFCIFQSMHHHLKILFYQLPDQSYLLTYLSGLISTVDPPSMNNASDVEGFVEQMAMMSTSTCNDEN